jgi:hypothetical protein
MEVNGEIPPALSALIMRLLAKKPEARVQTAAELTEQLVGLGYEGARRQLSGDVDWPPQYCS